ncbi:MAG: glycosyltransferase family 39 protein [Anaerolineales bacterium]|nr:glycosyltransferase family 39 protein [Anaerolineales bacterium]
MRGDIRKIIRETAVRYGVLAAAVAVSLAGKAALLAAQAVPFNADEAVVALMAKHILQGERPLFFYGQAYMGSLDAILVAGGFALLGPQAWIVRAVQGLLYAGTMAVWHRFCEEGFHSAAAARIAVLLLAVPPVFAALYTTASLGGYGEALFFGSLCMLLALQILRGKATPARWLFLGLAAGIGFWSFPLSLILSAPAVLAALFGKKNTPTPAAQARKGWILLGVGAILGALPWIVGWIRMGADVWNELAGSAIAGTLPGGWGAVLPLRLLNFFVFGLSALFGLRPSWELRWLVPALLPAALILQLGAAAAAVRGLRLRDSSRPARWMLAGSAVALLAVYLFTPFGNDPSGRYFLPLVPVAAVFAADLAIRAAPRFGLAAYLIPGVLIAYQAAGAINCAARNPPGITTQFDPVAQLDQRDLPKVIDFLRTHGETRGYSTYWVSFPLAFSSGEELIFTARLPYHEDLRHTPRDNRYAPYHELVENSDRVAYITAKNPALDALLESAFARLGVEYRIEQIGDYRIYYQLSRAMRPEELGLPG